MTYLERQKCYGPDKKILFNKQLLEVKGQSPMKVITVCDTPPYGHALTYQTSLTYLERQMLWPGKENNTFFLIDLEDKDQGPMNVLRYVTHRLMVMHPHT